VQLTYRPSLGARLLIFGVCLVAAQPIALVASSIVTWSEHVSARSYLVALIFFAPLAIGLAVWIVRHQSIRIDASSVIFVFTRYAVPRIRRIVYTDVSVATYVGGVIGVDNRPRPLIEFSTKSGEKLWVPLSIYTRKQIQDLMAALEARGVRFEGNGQVPR
jgi:hypothetical protein